MNGLDISAYQKGINFKAIKDAGKEFLILRAGYTGYSNGKSHYKDSQFETFYSESRKYNIPVGAYWYSCADSYEKGVSEAKYMYENCLKGKQFEFPIYIDVEDSHYQIKTKKGTTEAIIGFCETLENLGYYVGYYANLNWLNNHIDTKLLTKYDLWLAHWTLAPSLKYKFGLWQNSSRGKINGYSGYLDTDESYKDYPKIIKEKGLNGYSKDNSNNGINELDKYSDEELARMVWTGEFGNGERRKELLGYRYAAVQKLVNQGIGKLKSIDVIAREVIQGKWKNGTERKQLLEKAGYNYNEVQKRVNELLK